ncbi:hypothetical protein QYF36_006244 [Acer negundo]|nr:hypothetical protein QYF36_006244 [Acer negundo]
MILHLKEILRRLQCILGKAIGEHSIKGGGLLGRRILGGWDLGGGVIGTSFFPSPVALTTKWFEVSLMECHEGLELRLGRPVPVKMNGRV